MPNWRETRLDDSLKRAVRLLENNDPLSLLHDLGRGPGNHAGAAVKRLLPALAQLLNQLETSVANRASNSGAIAGELRENQAKIETALRQLVSGLEVMEASHGQPD